MDGGCLQCTLARSQNLVPSDIVEVAEAAASANGRCAPNMSCRFSDVRAAIRSLRAWGPRGSSLNCYQRAYMVAAQRSPWRSLLTAPARMSAIADAAGPIVRDAVSGTSESSSNYLSALMCVAARETHFLEPIVPSLSGCDGRIPTHSFVGLGQTSMETIADYLEGGTAVATEECDRLEKTPRFPVVCQKIEKGRSIARFRSRLPSHRTVTEPDRLHELLSADPALQLEFVTYTLWVKARPFRAANGRTNWPRTLQFYGDGTVNYGARVGGCLSCLAACVSPDGRITCPQAAAESCMNRAISSGTLAKHMADFARAAGQSVEVAEAAPAAPAARAKGAGRKTPHRKKRR